MPASSLDVLQITALATFLHFLAIPLEIVGKTCDRRSCSPHDRALRERCDRSYPVGCCVKFRTRDWNGHLALRTVEEVGNRSPQSRHFEMKVELSRRRANGAPGELSSELARLCIMARRSSQYSASTIGTVGRGLRIVFHMISVWAPI